MISTLSKVGFFFDVTKNGDLQYASGSLFALDKEHVNSDIYINLAKDESITGCGLSRMIFLISLNFRPPNPLRTVDLWQNSTINRTDTLS